MEVFYGFIVAMVISFLAGVGITKYFDPDKTECEAELPRHVECIWAPPPTLNKEDQNNE